MIGIRQILVILGVILLIRFIGKMMTARRNINDQEQYSKSKNESDKHQANAKKNFGKTTVQKINKRKIKDSEYTDFEEVDDC